MPRKKAPKKKEETAAIVGPDSVQVLQGNLFGKNVALVLCGETHEDAIDVTRRGGVFEPKGGWIELSKPEIFYDFDNDNDHILAQVFSTCKKSLPLGKAKEWAEQRLKSMDLIGQVVLLWVPDKAAAKVAKGKGFLVGFASEDDLDEEDEEFDLWLSTPELPVSVRDWVLEEESSEPIRSFEYGDLDQVAFQLNRRRLTEETIQISEFDTIVEERKIKLRKDGIWTWDDWFAHIRNSESQVEIELIIESLVPPWELALHRPSATDDPNKYLLPPAADFIRCMPEDEEGDVEDDYDPSRDGVGSYLDYVYRRFMDQMVNESLDSNDGEPKTTWLHCVDVRDLGCQTVGHSQMVRDMWECLLAKEEVHELLDEDPTIKPFLPLEPDESNEFIKFVPEHRMNPEEIKLDELRSSGVLLVETDHDEATLEDAERTNILVRMDGEVGDFTYPSFEGFFGQASEFLYYAPNIKLCYSPFLARCVKSLPNWEQFFTTLFLGGTIPDALAILDLEKHKDHLYIRTPIQQIWNEDTDSFDYAFRDDGEHYITYPFFPFIFYLYAKDSFPPRTWSSQLFTRVSDRGSEPARIANSARDWISAKIQQFSADPKGFDDPLCGGEWFEAYLYAEHRDIYGDIDRSDSTVLLQRNKIKSLTSGRKYNIGKIKIPSCKDGFDEITERFAMPLEKNEQVVTSRVEVLGQILIDIWMASLVDYTTILQIAEIVSRHENSNKDVVVVVYMGSAHTRALTDFCVKHMGFKKKSFVGKTSWDEGERRTLKLPQSLWNIDSLFS